MISYHIDTVLNWNVKKKTTDLCCDKISLRASSINNKILAWIRDPIESPDKIIDEMIDDYVEYFLHCAE